jgi:Zn-dependent peptidase ImmA (M78 family)
MERSDVGEDRLCQRFPKLEEWRSGARQPTFRQLQDFAKATHTPIGYLFLNEPPVEQVPIPDFRTIGGQQVAHPSPNLLETIYLCQQRQEWYQQYARSVGEAPLSFVGSVNRSDDIVATADRIREALGFSIDQRRRLRTWMEALRTFIRQADELGVLVMVSGVVGSNTRRKLDPDEFRGFALVDPFAPVVFVNGADSKAAQMFTVAHELAHLWLGESALSDVSPRFTPAHDVERWCNRVAAELLVPLAAVRDAYQEAEPLQEELSRLARQFKVSTLVILRRLYDARRLNRDQFGSAYDAELQRLREVASRGKGGGDYYLTTPARVSHRLARAVATAAWEGRASFTEAFRLLGCRKMATFEELAQTVGVNR